jgi:putative transposase
VANMVDQEGIKQLLECGAKRGCSRAFHACGWTLGLQGPRERQRLGTEKVLGWSVELAERPRKATPEEVLMSWAEELAKEGKMVDWQKLLPPRAFQLLPRRWVVERSFAWIGHNRRMSKDYEKLCATSEAFVYAAMSRLMLRRLART